MADLTLEVQFGGTTFLRLTNLREDLNTAVGFGIGYLIGPFFGVNRLPTPCQKQGKGHRNQQLLHPPKLPQTPPSSTFLYRNVFA